MLANRERKAIIEYLVLTEKVDDCSMYSDDDLVAYKSEKINPLLDVYDMQLFSEYESLLGCSDFERFEHEYDDLIFYADGLEESVLNAIEVENLKVEQFDLCLFDGWFVALWKY